MSSKGIHIPLEECNNIHLFSKPFVLFFMTKLLNPPIFSTMRIPLFPFLILALFFIFTTPVKGVAQSTPVNTIADIIRFHGCTSSEETALIFGDSMITWGQLYHRALQVACALEAEGITSQDRVLFLDKNGIEHFEVLFGSSMLNAVSVDINWRLAPEEISFIVNDTRSQVLIVGSEFIPIINSLADQFSFVKKIVVMGKHEKYENYHAWVAQAPAIDPRVVIKGTDIVHLYYTSGTTGRPKGVMLSNDSIFQCVNQALENYRLTKSSVNLVAMPLFHVGGSMIATCGLLSGCKSIIVSDLKPENLIKVISQNRISHALIVPSILQLIVQIPDIAKYDFSSIETIIYGASPISEKVLGDAIRIFKCNFWQAYGLTETAAGIVSLPPQDHVTDGPELRHLKSAGKAKPGVELRIVDPVSMQDVTVGEIGEIWTRSKQNMAGYWNLPDETAATILSDGWLRTGDAGYLDSDGYLYLTDRIKDMIISGGENIYPAEIENILMSFPGIIDSAVIGVPSERWGETPKAFVVVKEGSEISSAEIIAYCREQLAHYKCPTSVDFVESIPRNPSGKILKRQLREPFWKK